MVSKRSKLIHAVVKIVLSRLAPKFKNQVSFFFFFFFHVVENMSFNFPYFFNKGRVFSIWTHSQKITN